ncbi:MAG: HD domain-containing protein [Caldiserica bacterium]|nr:HD domain-containing protein [Caldisericota bacterium]
MDRDRRLLKRNLSLGAAMAALLLLFGSLLYLFSLRVYDAEASKAVERELAQLQRLATAIRGAFLHYVKDLSLLRELREVREFVERGATAGEPARMAEDLFIRFAAARPEYYQVRIIAASGWEAVRVERRRDGTVRAVPPEGLQYKGDRYYFTEAISLDEGEIYVSELDLNVEHGEIEVPYVPVIRLATPLFDAGGERRALLVINVYAADLLSLLAPGMFVQTDAGYRFSVGPDGGIEVREARADLPGNRGLVRPGVEGGPLLLYRALELAPGRRLIVVKELDLEPTRALYLRLVGTAVGGFAAAIGLASVVTVAHLRRERKLRAVQEAMINALAVLADERDQVTGAHLERVRRYSALLARELRRDPRYRTAITDEFIADIMLAGPLHDIGKVGIPDAILLKPGPLTEEEWRIMKGHVRIGAQILERAIERYGLRDRYLAMAKNICAYHHERYDGTGYLEGLKGEEIPLEARIFAVADAYDAMRSKRPYKDPLPHDEAVRRIVAASGTQFDPAVVEAFLRCEGEFRRVSEAFR